MKARAPLTTTVAVLLLLGGCTTAGEPPQTSASEPTATGATPSESPGVVQGAIGDPVPIAGGEQGGFTWTATYTDSDLGECVVIAGSGDEDAGATDSVGCSFEVPQRHDVGSVLHPSAEGDIVAGPVSDATTSVLIVLEDGTEVEVDPVTDPGLPTPHFAAQLAPGASAREVVALDDSGAELERRPVGGR